MNWFAWNFRIKREAASQIEIGGPNTGPVTQITNYIYNFFVRRLSPADLALPEPQVNDGISNVHAPSDGIHKGPEGPGLLPNFRTSLPTPPPAKQR